MTASMVCALMVIAGRSVLNINVPSAILGATSAAQMPAQ